MEYKSIFKTKDGEPAVCNSFDIMVALMTTLDAPRMGKIRDNAPTDEAKEKLSQIISERKNIIFDMYTIPLLVEIERLYMAHEPEKLEVFSKADAELDQLEKIAAN